MYNTIRSSQFRFIERNATKHGIDYNCRSVFLNRFLESCMATIHFSW